MKLTKFFAVFQINFAIHKRTLLTSTILCLLPQIHLYSRLNNQNLTNKIFLDRKLLFVYIKFGNHLALIVFHTYTLVN